VAVPAVEVAAVAAPAPKKRGPKKKEPVVATEETPVAAAPSKKTAHPFDKFQEKLNKRIRDESATASSTVDEQTAKLADILREWMNAAKTNRSTEDVLHLIRGQPQFIALIDEPFKTASQEEYAGVLVGPMGSIHSGKAFRVSTGETSGFVVELV
jgi:hypothetical protein